MSKYAICRILGNENVPRDRPGSRLKTLEFILKNEPKFLDTEKIYVLNRLVNPDFRKANEELLQTYKAKYVVVEVPWNEMLNKPNLSDIDINFYVIGINATRNTLIEYAHRSADYAVILDGDCIFDHTGWGDFVATVNSRPGKYYSIPMIRMTPEAYFDGFARDCTEPQLAFRKDAELRFDVNLPFGHRDKLELLFALGHDKEMDKGHNTIEGDKTCLAGYVCHLNTGIEAVETDQIDRLLARDISLHRLVMTVRYRLAAMQQTG
jgi:hypothetical protein